MSRGRERNPHFLPLPLEGGGAGEGVRSHRLQEARHDLAEQFGRSPGAVVDLVTGLWHGQEYPIGEE